MNKIEITPATIVAFKLGLADRLAGRPMIAHPEADEPEASDAYCFGYDPHDEMGLTMPEHAQAVKIVVGEYVRLCCPEGVPVNMPRNKCEFPS